MENHLKLKGNNVLKKADVTGIPLTLIFAIIIPTINSQFIRIIKEKIEDKIINYNPLIKTFSPLNFDGLIDDLYLSDGTRIYYGNSTYQNAYGDLYVIDNTSLDPNYVWIAFVINPYFVDNTYGNGTVPQYKNPSGGNCGHSFSDLLTSDVLDIKLYNTNNVLVFNARTDIIH